MSKTIFICFRTLEIGWKMGGAGHQTFRLSGELLNKGYQVKMVAGKRGWGIFTRESFSYNGQSIPIVWLRTPPIPIKGVESVFFLLWFALYLLIHIPRRPVIQVVGILRVTAIMIAIAKITRRRVICRVMAVDAYNLFEQKTQGNLLTYLQITGLLLADHVIAQNTEILRKLQALGVKRVAYIPNGVDIDYFKPGNRIELRQHLDLPVDAQIIVYAGRLIPSKHIDVMIRALADYKRSLFLLLGEGPERANLQTLAQSLGVKMHMTGFVENPIPYYQAADVFVITSTMEGHSNALIEAMACGLPVVATGISGNDETIQSGVNGLLVPPENVKALSSALTEVMRDTERFAINARQTVVDHYSIAYMVEQYLKLYQS